MEHLTSVTEETEHELTAANTSTARTDAHDDAGQGEKIRVDRRKLELMLQANGDESGLTAEAFFNQIMRDTDTLISWPSKLKIGAKSKKDPHIKIAGLPENIKKAKDMVSVKLESKANRVTLKMDVSHTDHSHIIGRRGQNINRIMDETNCHIHFPDSNRGSASAEKSNQVSITGQPEGVEKARSRIREMLPLVLCFEVANYDNMFLPLDPMLPCIQSIAQRYDVTFSAKGRTQMGCLVVAVRGSQDRVGFMKDAMSCLCKQLTGSSELPSVVQLHLEVAPQHHVFLVGRSACNLREIMEQTSAKIELPVPRLSTRNGTITVTGAISAVIQARALLVSYLPLLMMFDLKEEEARHLQDEPDKVKQIMDKFGVTVSIKPKQKQTSKSVTIKSREGNAQNMYLTRLEILGNPMDPHTMQRPSPLSLRFSQQGTPWFHNYLPSPNSSPLASPTPHSVRSDSPISFARRTPPPNTRPPPGFDIWRQHRSESFNNGDYHRRAHSADADLTQVPRGAASEGGSPKQSFDFTSARRNSEPSAMVDVWTPPSPAVNHSKAPGPAVALAPNTKQQRYTILDGIKNAGYSGSHRLLDSHGSNPASSFDSFASTSLNFDRVMDSSPQNKFADYEKQKGMADELMTRKVAQPEVRFPTDLWSGLHLSKSEDFTALKKKRGTVERETADNESTSQEVKDPELDRAVMRNPSASMQVSRGTKGIQNPFSPQASQTFETPSGLDGVLKLYGVEELAERFKSLEINNLKVFMSLTKEDLKEAGIGPLGVRKKIENIIADMKKIEQDTIKNTLAYRAQRYRVSNPLEFGSTSGRY